ncbi:hypothetical protein MKX01_032194 [Papaver californicum]|nr:hypothetical protein MKX01_032194 [Papaver californicum]
MRTDVYVFSNCSGDQVKDIYVYSSLNLKKFTYSTTNNTFIAVGCNIFAYIMSDLNTFAAMECKATCNKPEDAIDWSCLGIGCCQTSIPAGLASYRVEVRELDDMSPNTCKYGFLAETSSFNSSSSYMKDLKK